MSDAARRVQPGDLLRVRDAHGDVIEVQAVSGLYRGRNFPVVLVCWPRSYSLPPKERPTVPWPAEDVLEIVPGGVLVESEASDG